MIKTLALLSSLAAVSLAGLERDGNGRRFLPADITGEYSRFVKQGTCARTVNITSFSSLAPGAFSVPHEYIYEDGYMCTSDGAFTVVTKDAIVRSGNEFILENAPEPLATVVNALDSQDATFMLGFENTARVCGPSGTSANSIAIFVEEENRIEIPGLITLYPGAKYMIVYEPTSPTPCTYFSQFADSVIGIPPTETPKPTAVPVTPEPIAQDLETTAEPAGAEVVVDDSAAAGAAAAGSTDAEPVADESAAAETADDSVDREPVDVDAQPADEGAESDGSDGDVIAPVPVAPVAVGDSDIDAESDESLSTGSDGATVVGETVDEDLEGSLEPELSASPEEENDGSVCFPGAATVELENGEVKRMDEIELGDRVKVGAGEFSPVFMFTHKNGGLKYSFVRLVTESGKRLRLTKGHYLYVNGALAAAKSVRVGDSLRTEAGLTTVREVSTVSDIGLYNPQTVDGKIVVNGIVASTYTTTVEARTAHSMLAPVRALFGWNGMAMSLFENGADGVAGFMPSGKVVA